MAKKPDGKKSGGNGKGGSKGIAGREAQQLRSRNLKKSAQKRREHGALMRGGDKPGSEEVIFSVADMIAGKASTGCLFEASGSVFELGIDDSRHMYTLKKGVGELARWTSQGEITYVLVQDLLLNSFKPRLQGPLADKQWEMWKAVSIVISNDQIDQLADRLRREQIASEAATYAAIQAERYVGPADPAVWNTAIGDPSKFEDAFKALTSDGNVNLRLGKTSDIGAVIEVTYKGEFMAIKPVHIGKDSPMAGVVLKSTYLRCKAGRLDEVKPEIFGDRAEGIAAIWSFIMNTDYVPRTQVRDVMMNAMYHTYRRLHSQPPKLVASNGERVKPITAPAVAAPAPAPASMQEAKPAPIRPTGKVSRKDAGNYVLAVMPHDTALELIMSGAPIKTLLSTAEAFAAQKQQATAKSA